MKSKGMLIGMVGGLAAGMIGIGGGIIMVPGMVYFLGIEQHTAHATSLAAIMPLAIVSAIVYGTYGNLDISLALMFAAGGVLGGYLGAALMPHVNPKTLKNILGILCILAAIKMGGGL